MAHKQKQAGFPACPVFPDGEELVTAARCAIALAIAVFIRAITTTTTIIVGCCGTNGDAANTTDSCTSERTTATTDCTTGQCTKGCTANTITCSALLTSCTTGH